MLSLYLKKTNALDLKKKKREKKKKRKKKESIWYKRFRSPLTLPLPSFPPPTFLNTTSFCAQSPLLYFSSSLLGLASPPLPPDMASHQGGPSRIGTPAPLSPLPTTGNLNHLVTLFHQTAADLGLPAPGFPPITPGNISTVSIGEQMLLPLLCTSLQSSVHIATALESLSTEIHDLSSQVANLDFSPQPPNLAPLQASLRDIASRLPSAAQASFPPQRPSVPQQATHSSAGSHSTPTNNTNPARQEKGKERAPPAPPPPPPNTVSPSPSADPDLPRYDMSTSSPTPYSNPEAFAKKYPHTWEAEEFAKGKYPPGPAWTRGHLDPDWRPPTTMTPKATPTYAQAAALPGKGKKGRQTKGTASASSVAVASGEVFTKSPPPLPQTVHRFFASRTTFEPHPEGLQIGAHFPNIAASVLREANCSLPLSFTCTVNDKGSVSLLGTDLHTPASVYTPYFAPLTWRLNKAFPIGNSPWDIFKPTPNEAQLLIHSAPLAFLPSDDDQLFPSLHESIRNARGVSILSARYLNPDTESRGQKAATSVVVTVAPPDAYGILPSINLFSRSRRVEHMFSSSKNSQCKKCWKFSHIPTRCPSTLSVSPFCSLAHTKAEHRCPNPSSPKGGNLQPVLACYPSSVACCPNCQEEHSARSRDCPSRPKATPGAPKVLSRQTQDSMDLAEDQAGPSTVLPPTPCAAPRTPSAPVLPRDAPPPRQRAQCTITVTDLAPRESGDESLDSDSSEGSAQ